MGTDLYNCLPYGGDEMKTKTSTRFPWTHVIGYISSILLTLAALWFTLSTSFSQGSVITGLLVLASLQILIQLFCFMHITDGRDSAYHAIAIGIAFLFMIAVIVGSIWIMSFDSQVQ